jgi:hypothetical protein
VIEHATGTLWICHHEGEKNRGWSHAKGIEREWGDVTTRKKYPRSMPGEGGTLASPKEGDQETSTTSR